MAREKFTGNSNSDSKKGARKTSGSGSRKRTSSSTGSSSDKKFTSKTDKPFSKFRKDKESSFDKKDKFKKNDKYKSDKRDTNSYKKTDDAKSTRSYKKGEDGKYYSNTKPDLREDKPYKKAGFDDKDKNYGKRDDYKSGDYKKREEGSFSAKHKTDGRRDKPYKKSSDGDKDKSHSFSKHSADSYKSKDQSEYKGIKKRRSDDKDGVKRYKKEEFKEGKSFKSYDKEKQDFKDNKFRGKEKPRDDKYKKSGNPDGLIRLNKYLANAGISSRRDADTLILSGTVKVNGVVVDQLGFKVKSTDVVSYADATIKNERKIYLLLNKPKDFITTTDDPQERRTVMELVKPACKERIYPVGRLDRNTTGLLLFSNDGDLATKLMHPKYEIRKVYHVTLNKAVSADDFKKIAEGLELEDGPVKVDDVAYVGDGKKEIGIELHSGRNRIVRRIFEHLGYDVIKLDRVVYAGLTKKDLPRGKYRFLSEKEVAFLKMLH